MACFLLSVGGVLTNDKAPNPHKARAGCVDGKETARSLKQYPRKRQNLPWAGGSDAGFDRQPLLWKLFAQILDKFFGHFKIRGQLLGGQKAVFQEFHNRFLLAFQSAFFKEKIVFFLDILRD